ncbi:MAG: PQQ-binding-like beta-propeller repeat protein, partial [Planctomycetota bacterium]
MGAERFIEKLAEQGALPESVIKRLRDKVAGASSVPSPRALAQFLVDKKHLTREAADAALAASAPPRRKRKPKPPAADAERKASTRERSSRRRSSAEADADPFALPDTPAGGDAAAATKPARGKGGNKKYKKKKKGENEFDTPLMLLGGGALVLMVLAIGGLSYLFFRESGDERLNAARTAFEAGSYAQAIQDYETFVEKFSGHEGYSNARVTLGVARIRNVADSNSELALKTAKQEIPQIQDEPDFAVAQEDLASLLPKMAADLSDQADAAEGLEEIRKYVALTEEALALAGNPKYVPNRLRQKQEIAQIKTVLARIGLRQQALESLEETLSTMKSAVAAGDTKTAYSAHAGFVKAHPEKAGDEELLAAVAAASQAEKAGIRFVDDPGKPLTVEPSTAVSATIATADQRRTGTAPAAGVTVVSFQGAAYALSRRDGSLVWRRPLGGSLKQVTPLRVGDDCVLLDAKRGELVRVRAGTGDLVWRCPLEDDVAQPTLLGDRLLAAGESGRLHVLDAASGAKIGHVQFAQPLRSSPAVSQAAGRVYLVGEHSSVYTLDAASLDCLGVYYLGHAKGAVAATPALVLNRVAVMENDGAATSRLHLFGLDERGVIDRELAAGDQAGIRLPGLVKQPPQVFGKRFSLVTDSGHIGVYEVSSEETDRPLTLLGTRAARRQARANRYSALVDQQLWVGGSGLARHSIQPAGNRLPAIQLKENFRGDTFVHPLDVAGGVVIHVRRRRGRAGATVAASNARSGALYWETDIAAPASGPPVASRAAGGLLYATAAGRVFLIDQAALASGVTSRVVGGDGAALLDTGATASGGGVFAASGSGAAVGVSAAAGAVQPLRLPGELACPPQRFAEGWLALLTIGQAHYFDGGSGLPLAAPFQPVLKPGQLVPWGEPSVAIVDGQPTIFASDGGQSLYGLRLVTSPTPHLAAIGQTTLEDAASSKTSQTLGAADGQAPLAEAIPDAESAEATGLAEAAALANGSRGPERFTTRVATAAGMAAVATSGNRLMLFDTATLELAAAVPLESAV